MNTKKPKPPHKWDWPWPPWATEAEAMRAILRWQLKNRYSTRKNVRAEK